MVFPLVIVPIVVLRIVSDAIDYGTRREVIGALVLLIIVILLLYACIEVATKIYLWQCANGKR
jgi:hypothetical protein